MTELLAAAHVVKIHVNAPLADAGDMYTGPHRFDDLPLIPMSVLDVYNYIQRTQARPPVDLRGGYAVERLCNLVKTTPMANGHVTIKGLTHSYLGMEADPGDDAEIPLDTHTAALVTFLHNALRLKLTTATKIKSFATAGVTRGPRGASDHLLTPDEVAVIMTHGTMVRPDPIDPAVQRAAAVCRDVHETFDGLMRVAKSVAFTNEVSLTRVTNGASGACP